MIFSFLMRLEKLVRSIGIHGDDDSETSAKHFKELLDAIPETDEIKIYFNSKWWKRRPGDSHLQHASTAWIL